MNKNRLYKKIPKSISNEDKDIIVNGLLNNLSTEEKKIYFNILNNYKDDVVLLFLKKKTSILTVSFLTIANYICISNIVMNLVALILTCLIVGKISIDDAYDTLDRYTANLEKEISKEVDEKLKRESNSLNNENTNDKELNHHNINNISYIPNIKLTLRKDYKWKK